MPKKGLPTVLRWNLLVFVVKPDLHNGLGMLKENPVGYLVPRSTPEYPHFTALYRATEFVRPKARR